MILKILRWIAFVILLLTCFYFIDLGIGWLAFKASDYGTKWLIIFLLVGGLSIPFFFIGIAHLFSISIFLICPHKKVGGIFMGISAIMVCIGDLVSYYSYDCSLLLKIVIYLLVLLVWIPFLVIGIRIKDNL